MTTNWKAFDTSTEAGKLLQQLYGGQMKNPNIEYPKLQPRADAAKQRPKFIPGGAREGASDPRAATKRAANVNVPKMGRHERARPAAIEYVEKRRSGAVIDAQVQDAKMRLECYRPPNVKPFSTDAEKAKVQERFEFGGGRCLPEELTHHAGPLPSEMVAKRKPFNSFTADIFRRALDEDQLPSDTSGTSARLLRASDVFIAVYSIHRSPLYWENPDEFDPHRFKRPFHNPDIPQWKGFDPEKWAGQWYPNEVAADFAYLPFGGGPRKCVGDKFALLEATVALAMVLRRYDFSFAAPTEEPSKVGTNTGATIHTRNGLYMTLKRRHGQAPVSS